MHLLVNFRGTQHTVEASPDELLSVLQSRLDELTGVPPSLQKLLYKGKKPKTQAESTALEQAGLKDGMKVQLLGSREAELVGMRTAENEKRRREEILRQRGTTSLPKVRSILV